MIKTTGSRSVTLRHTDAEFVFSPDGITVVPRAGIEIALDCPYNYKLILVKCLDQGWLRPVAHMRDVEYTMELLRR
jgi:hypothetical protein